MGGQGFRVDPDALAQLSAQVGRQGECAQGYVDYELPDKGFLAEAQEGILFTIWSGLDRWQELGRSNTAQGAELATAAGEGLHHAAVLYRELDLFQAARLDDTYGPGASYTRIEPPDAELAGRLEQLLGGGRGPFEDVVDLDEFRPGHRSDSDLERELLRTGEELSAKAEQIMGLASYFGQYRALLKDILGFDPWEEVAKVAIGDWKALTDEGLDFAAVANTFDGIQQNLDHGRLAIQDEWTGVAASRALAWLERYSSACAGHAEFMRAAGNEILHLARGVYHRYAAFSGTLDAAVDSFIDAMVKGPISAGVGQVIALARGENPLEVFGGVILAFGKVSEAAGEIMALVHAFLGIVETVAGMGDAATASWPPRPYEHPSFQ